MAVDLDAMERVQTGRDPDPQPIDPDRVDGAGKPLPPGYKFDKRGFVLNETNLKAKGFKQRKDLNTAGPENRAQAKAQGITLAPPPTQPEPVEKPSKVTRTKAEQKLGIRWGQFWDLCAEGWDDDTLRVTEAERREWAEPVAYVLEQMGWLEHTEKLDWIGAVAVTSKQAWPRARKMLAQHPRGISAHPDGQRQPPEFRRPAGMGQRNRGVPVGMPPDTDEILSPGAPSEPNQPIAAEGASNPLPLNSLFMPREAEL